METNDTCNPSGIPDQSDRVSTVGSGSSLKVSVVLLSPCVHAIPVVNNKPQIKINTFFGVVISYFLFLLPYKLHFYPYDFMRILISRIKLSKGQNTSKILNLIIAFI